VIDALRIRGPKVIVAPDAEPIDIEECRAHLEAAPYGDTDVDLLDDAMITGWLAAAREYCEQFLGLSLSRRQLEVALDRFPNTSDDGSTAIELPFGPVLDIVSVGVEVAGASSSSSTTSSSSDGVTLDPADYRLDDYSSPNRLLPTVGWPASAGELSVRIRYLAGYGADSDGGIELPWAARAAMLLVLGHLYAHREEGTDKAMSTLPLGAEALLRPLRVRLGVA
jgi:uncharacterized phiE125 gp8 family phage protein